MIDILTSVRFFNYYNVKADTRQYFKEELVMATFLTVISGIAWIIVYEECIRIGLKNKTYCMPLFALGLNLAWESIHSIYGFMSADYSAQTIVNALWGLLDIVILYTYFKYGKEEFGNGKYSKTEFYAWGILVVVTSYLVQWGFVLDFGRVKAMQYSAYIQNLIMSVMFLAMLEKRQSSKGQSMLLAVAKWIGTLAPLGIVSMNYGTSEFQPLIIILGIFCSVYDLMYIYLLGKRIKAEKGQKAVKICLNQ